MDKVLNDLILFMKEELGTMGPFFLGRELKKLNITNDDFLTEEQKQTLFDVLVKEVLSNTGNLDKIPEQKKRLKQILFVETQEKSELTKQQKVDLLSPQENRASTHEADNSPSLFSIPSLRLLFPNVQKMMKPLLFGSAVIVLLIIIVIFASKTLEEIKDDFESVNTTSMKNALGQQIDAQGSQLPSQENSDSKDEKTMDSSNLPDSLTQDGTTAPEISDELLDDAEFDQDAFDKVAQNLPSSPNTFDDNQKEVLSQIDDTFEAPDNSESYPDGTDSESLNNLDTADSMLKNENPVYDALDDDSIESSLPEDVSGEIHDSLQEQLEELESSDNSDTKPSSSSDTEAHDEEADNAPLDAAQKCDATSTGTIHFNAEDNHFYGCTGTKWVQLDN